jgi:hypothetical protein
MNNFDLRKYLAEGKLFEEDFKNPILDKYLELKKSIDYKTVFPTDLQSFLDSLDNTEREGLERDLAEGKLFEAAIKFIDYVTVDQDEFKTQYNKHYDDYGNDEDFIEEFGRDFLSPNIKAINQYYGAKVSADDVIEDFFSAGGISNISSKEEFEAWLDKNREFYI